MTDEQKRLLATAYAASIAALNQLRNTSKKVPVSSLVLAEIEAAMVDIDQTKAVLEELIESTVLPEMAATERLTR